MNNITNQVKSLVENLLKRFSQISSMLSFSPSLSITVMYTYVWTHTFQTISCPISTKFRLDKILLKLSILTLNDILMVFFLTTKFLLIN